jgi:hypothetical protein
MKADYFPRDIQWELALRSARCTVFLIVVLRADGGIAFKCEETYLYADVYFCYLKTREHYYSQIYRVWSFWNKNLLVLSNLHFRRLKLI